MARGVLEDSGSHVRDQRHRNVIHGPACVSGVVSRELLEAIAVETEFFSHGLPAQCVAILFSTPVGATESLGVALQGTAQVEHSEVESLKAFSFVLGPSARAGVERRCHSSHIAGTL